MSVSCLCKLTRYTASFSVMECPLQCETLEMKACSAEECTDMSIVPYQCVPSTDSEESFRSRQGVAGVQKALTMIQAPESVVEYIQPAPQVQYAQPQNVQQAPAVEQFSVTHLHGRATGGESLGVPQSHDFKRESCSRQVARGSRHHGQCDVVLGWRWS